MPDVTAVSWGRLTAWLPGGGRGRHMSCLGVPVRPTERAVLAEGVEVRGPALRLVAVHVW